VNDYGVKYKTVIADNDLAKLRDSPVFDEISNELKGASTEAQMIRIRTEAKVRAPPFAVCSSHRRVALSAQAVCVGRACDRRRSGWRGWCCSVGVHSRRS
jgi:hypothetical protein